MTSNFYKIDPTHDRRILERADETGWAVVMVKCPHTVGLCFETDGPALTADGEEQEEGWLANLPCPCNEISTVVAKLVPTN